MGLTSPLSRYRLYWRIIGAVFAFLLLQHVLCLHDTFIGGQTDDHLNPIQKIFRPKSSQCAQLDGIEDIFVVLKTGANEAREKLPVHFATTLQCIPNYAVYSDLEETVAGHRIRDALDEVDPEIVASHPDFVYYQSLKDGGRAAFSAQEVEEWNHAQNTMFGRDSPGWRLDKWKFLPLAEKALKQKSDAKWYVFMETDTYIVWSQMLLWLSHFWEEYPYYMGVQMQIGDDLFAYGGAGFVLSNTALRMVVKQYKLKKKYYDAITSDHWAGDCVLGMVAADANVQLQWSWPNLYGEKPNSMNFKDDFAGDEGHLWCHYVASYHHMTPADMLQFNEFETSWSAMVSTSCRVLSESSYTNYNRRMAEHCATRTYFASTYCPSSAQCSSTGTMFLTKYKTKIAHWKNVALCARPTRSVCNLRSRTRFARRPRSLSWAKRAWQRL